MLCRYSPFGFFYHDEAIGMNRYKIRYLQAQLASERRERKQEFHQMQSMIETLASQNQFIILKIQELQQ